ncbi:MAG: anti-sigma factor [Dehalococcoidia bacterium]
MTCDQVAELLEVHALGALDAGERASVERHLAECRVCRREASVYADTVAVLPEALATASPLQPPAALRDRILRAVEARPAPSPRGAAAALPAPDAAPPAPASQRRRPRVQRWTALWRLAAAGALLLAIGAGVWNVRLSQALTRERTQRTELAQLVGQQEVVLEVIDSDKTAKAFLRPPARDSQAYGKIYVHPDLPYVVAMAARLPQPPDGQRYHLWLTGQGETRLAGVLTMNDEGFGLLVLQSDRNGPVYEAADLTLQEEGTTAPMGTPVLAWRAAR